jgi:glycosidase
VTTLWISPIVQNVDSDANIDAYHGYWQQDLTKLNPHMGDLASLRSMIAHAHDIGLKIVLDIVCNHMGQVFFYDINKNGEPDDYVNGSGGLTWVRHSAVAG